MINKIDNILDGPGTLPDGGSVVRLEVQAEKGTKVIELSLHAALQLHAELARYLEARVGIGCLLAS